MSKIIASIDVGLKRIGLALCINGVVMPQAPIIRKNRKQASVDVKKFLDDYRIDLLVVGIPIGGSSEEEMSRRIRHFINLIEFDKEIKFIDESFSSVEASDIYTNTKRDGKLDSISAMVILKRFLNQ